MTNIAIALVVVSVIGLASLLIYYAVLKRRYSNNSILQAKEYFSLAQNATLYTQPVLLYYGYINLLSATYVLKNGKIPNVENHGMVIIKNGDSIG